MARKYDWDVRRSDNGKWDWCIWHYTRKAPYHKIVSEGWDFVTRDAAYNDMLRYVFEHGMTIYQ